MSFDIRNIRQDRPVSPNGVIVYWLAGSGFALKFASGEIVCIDPYLSDCVERIAGFRRLSLTPLTASELQCDLLLISHDHPDHLDPDSFADIAANNREMMTLAPGCCNEFLQKKNVLFEIIAPGSKIEYNGITVKVVDADHGDFCDDAVGFLIQFGERSIYFTGDTSLNETAISSAITTQPEILLPCINGAFGNLNELEAAKLAVKCKSTHVIPCHFWLFAEHGGSPGQLKEHLQLLSPEIQTHLLTPGRGEEL